MKVIEIPGSKSLTNRALIIASLADGKSIITGHSKSIDSLVLINALKKLGIKISEKPDTLTIIGNGGKFKPLSGVIEVGSAGTAVRFLASLIKFVPGNIVLKGSKRISKRPLKELTDALLKVNTGRVSIKGDVSSQFISSLLMTAPLMKKGLVINIVGKLVSKSYVDMTIEVMEKFGVKTINKQYKKFIVGKGRYLSVDYRVEGDASGASYFWGIAAVTGQSIRVKNINPLSKQGDIRFPQLLKKMGCQVKKNIRNCWIEVKGPNALKGINTNMNLMPDTAQTLAVVAAFARGKTKITGLKTLKLKETDRLIAMQNELEKIGIKSQITSDSITIHGGNPQPAIIETYDDHRMAMSFAVAKARIHGLIIRNPEVVKKSFPKFWEKFNSLNL